MYNKYNLYKNKTYFLVPMKQLKWNVQHIIKYKFSVV